jgi:hypothetical protein
MSRPTRRYHLRSALRPSSRRIDAGAAHSLVGAGARLIGAPEGRRAHPLHQLEKYCLNGGSGCVNGHLPRGGWPVGLTPFDPF